MLDIYEIINALISHGYAAVLASQDEVKARIVVGTRVTVVVFRASAALFVGGQRRAVFTGEPADAIVARTLAALRELPASEPGVRQAVNLDGYYGSRKYTGD